MSALPERTVAMTEAAIGAPGLTRNIMTRETYEEHRAKAALEAAMDPTLGPDRLVVAGPFEQEMCAKLAEWLHDKWPRDDMDYWDGLAAEILTGVPNPCERTQ